MNFLVVSLRRINKQHDMNTPTVTVPNDKDLDFYHIKLDMSKNGTDRTASGPSSSVSLTKQNEWWLRSNCNTKHTV